MKKLVLTMVALVAMTMSCFAQYFMIYEPLSLSSSSYSSSYSLPSVSYSVPSVSYSVPSVTYSVPSTVNYNTISVSGYSRNDGVYVDSYVRTMPNNTNWDNFSTKGNTNPFTGSTGYRARDYSIDALNYGVGHTIYTGPKGGQYYYNSNGHKTYVPKRPW